MIIKKDDLISEISQRMNLHKYSIKEVLNCLENVINDNLLKGVKLKSKLVPSHRAVNPKTNEIVTVNEKFNISCKITDYHKRNLK